MTHQCINDVVNEPSWGYFTPKSKRLNHGYGPRNRGTSTTTELGYVVPLTGKTQDLANPLTTEGRNYLRKRKLELELTRNSGDVYYRHDDESPRNHQSAERKAGARYFGSKVA